MPLDALARYTQRRRKVEMNKIIRIGAAMLGLIPSWAQAETWPDKPVHIVVPLTAGSATDVMARTVAVQLSEQLGQPFIVDNKPGAGGTIGMGAVARAKPDGYTFLVQSASYTITPITYPNTPYDTQRDLVGVTPLAQLPQALIISPAKGITTVQQLVAAAKAKPGAFTYASAGVGTANQLSAERFRVGAGIDALHVPFKGTPEAVTEVMAGRVDYYFCPVNVCLPMIHEKRVLALGIGSSKRATALPDLPTTVELGVPESNYDFWVGMFAPAGTPREIVDKLYAETVKAFAAPKVKESFTQLGAEPDLLEPRAFDERIKKEIATNAALVKASGIPISSQ
jgi:tripartite-type tricarboxylate transporter receptor subunit TctC